MVTYLCLISRLKKKKSFFVSYFLLKNLTRSTKNSGYNIITTNNGNKKQKNSEDAVLGITIDISFAALLREKAALLLCDELK